LLHKSLKMAKSTTTKAKKEPVKPEYLEAKAEEVGHIDPANVIQLSPSTDVKIINPQEQAAAEVAKFDIARSWISGKKEEYSTLTVNGVEDKEGLKKITEAWQEIKGKRFAVRDKHEELKAGYLIVGRAIDKEKNELTALLKEIEDPLKAQIERIENEKEQIRQQKDKEAQERIQARVVELLDNGVKLVGNFYTIGETVSVDISTIRDFDEVAYADFLGRVKKENAALVAAEEKRIAEEKAEKEAQEKLAADNKRITEELQKQQDQIKKEISDSRGEFLENLGYVKSVMGNYEYIKAKDLYTSVDGDSLGEMTREQWEEMKVYSKQAVKDIDTELSKREVYSKRISTLTELGGFTLENNVVFAVAYDAENIVICDLDELKTISDEEFNSLTQSTRKAIAEEKENYRLKQVAETDRQARAAVHINDMFHLGFTVNGNAYTRQSKVDPERMYHIHKEKVENSTVEEWGLILDDAREFVAELESYEEEYKKAAAVKKENERVAALSDAEKVTEWMKKVSALMADLPLPESEASPLFIVLQNFDVNTTIAFEEIERVINEITE
jgi:hypothetical protein